MPRTHEIRIADRNTNIAADFFAQEQEDPTECFMDTLDTSQETYFDFEMDLMMEPREIHDDTEEHLFHSEMRRHHSR